MLSVFSIWCFLCPVRCLLSFFAVPLFLGSLFEKIFGSELLFLGVGVCLACFGAVLPMFLLDYLLFRSRNCREKILLMSGLVFLGFLLSSFGCLADVVVFLFFFRETAQVVTGHTPTRTCFAFSFSVFCVPPRLFLPVLAVRPASWRFSGCHSGPRAFLGFSLDLLRPFSWDARRQGFSVLLLPCFSFSPCRCVLRLFFSHTRRGGPVIERGVPPGHRACPSPE